MSGSHTGGPARGTGASQGRPWHWVAGGTALVALLGGGAAALLTLTSAPATHPLAVGCGLVTCGASLPPAVTGLAVHSTSRADGLHHLAHRTAPSKPVRSRTPASSPSPAVTWTPGRGDGQGHHDGPLHHGNGDGQGNQDGDG